MGGLLLCPSPPPGEGPMIRAGRRARRGEMALGKGRMGYERGEGTRRMDEGLEEGWANLRE